MFYFDLSGAETGATINTSIKSSYNDTGFTYVMVLTNKIKGNTTTFLLHDISPFIALYSGDTTIAEKSFDYNTFFIELYAGACLTDFDPLIPKINFELFEGHSEYKIYNKGVNDGTLTYETENLVDEGFLYIHYTTTDTTNYYGYSKTYVTY